MAARTPTATFTSGRKRVELDIRRAYNTKQFIRMFQLKPDTIFMNADSLDGRVYLPDDEGLFDFPNMSPGPAEFDTIAVEGTSLGAPANGKTRTSEPTTPNGGNSSQSNTVTATPPTWSGFQSVVRQTPSQKKAAAASFSLKVVRANLTHFEGDCPNFDKQGKTYVELTEATTNMQYVTSAV